MYKSEFNSICNNLPKSLTYFSEDSISQKMFIPDDYPDIDEIIDIYTYPEIVNLELVSTKTGLSNEGDRLTGQKLIAQINIRQKMTYTTTDNYKSICALEYEIFKNIAINIPESIDEKNIHDLFKSSRINVNPFIEHVSTRKSDCRSFNLCSLVLLDTQIC